MNEIDVVHLMTKDGCKISVNGQGHLPCKEHLGQPHVDSGDTPVLGPAVDVVVPDRRPVL